MITDSAIQTRFIHDTLSQGITLIYQTQERVVETYLNSRSGDLLKHLQRRPFDTHSMVEKEIVYMRIFPYLRYLDIHSRKGADRISRHLRKNMALYNRVVWGVLYRETLPAIHHGFTDEVRINLRRELEQALLQEQSK